MKTTATVSFDDKLAHLCGLADIGKSKLLSDLEQRGLRRSIVLSWFSQPSPTIRANYREKFLAYWREVYDLPFSHACFDMPFDAFKQFMADGSANKSLTKAMQRFAGCYQLVRPHAFEAEQYVLEPLEIAFAQNGASSLMYSHTQPDRRYLYEGKGYCARNYYSSMLVREHESDPRLGAFRNIMLYVGENALPDRLSGLRLRGVSGRNGGDQAIAAPFVALRMPEKSGLRQAELSETQNPALRELHRDGHILVGEVDASAVGVHAWCKMVFDGIKSLRRGVIQANGLVLHTIAPANLRSIKSFDSQSWTVAVNALRQAA